MALAIRKKKKPATALVPFNPEQIMQGEPSAQGVKVNMTAQLLMLYLEPKIKTYKPFLEMFGIQVNPEMLISVISQNRNDARMRSLLLSVSEIIKAACDDQVTPQAFEDILFCEAENIKREEVPA